MSLFARLLSRPPAPASDRAHRGACFLDAVQPGWAARVNLSTLSLADGEACVLGQLHGDYRLGLGRARVTDLSSAPGAGRLFHAASPVELGFQAAGTLGSAEEALDYAHLTRAWRREVEARQPQPAPERPQPARTTRRNGVAVAQ